MAVVFLLGSVAVARAQSLTTGAIQGTVTDAATGEPLAGVTITATARGRADAQTALSDGDGRYKITELLPGGYDVAFQFDRSSALRRDVVVSVDTTTTLYQKLKIGDVIEVHGNPPPIDVPSNEHAAHLDRPYLESMPLPGPDFTAALGAIGGSQNDGVGIAFSGSTSLENRYIVDGIDITGLTYGNVGTPLLDDFIADIDVITGGYNAEWGRATGGLVNIVTRSGSDTLRGSVFGVITPGWLTAAARTAPVNASSIDITSNRGYDGHAGFELGGPIVKGRAWFYVGLAPQYSSTDYTRTTKRETDCHVVMADGKLSDCERQYADGIPDVDPKTGFYITNTLDSDVRTASTKSATGLAKIDLAPTPGNRAQLSLIVLPSESTTPGLLGLPSSGTKVSGLTTDTAARWTTKLFDNATEVEALVAWHRSTLDSGSIDPTLDRQPLQILENGNLGTWSALGGESAKTAAGCADGGPNDPYPNITNCPMTSLGYAIGGPGAIQHDFEDRRDVRLSAIQRVRALGSHELKAGVDVEDDTKSIARLYSGGAVITNDVAGGQIKVQRWAELAPPGSTDPRFDQTCSTPTSGGATGTAAETFACELLPGTLGAPGTQVDSQSISWAAYLRDSWQPIPALTINAGLRYEEQRLYYASFLRHTIDPLTGEKFGAMAMDLTGNWAPRIGATYDPTGEGRAKLSASWGRFYEAIPMDINDRSFGGEVSDTRTYGAQSGACGAFDPKLGSVDGGNCTGKAQSEQLIGSSGVLVAPGIKAEYLDEAMAGAEVAVIPNVVFGISLQHRTLGRVIEDVSTDGANTYIIANPGEWPGDAERAFEQRIAATTDPTEHARLAHELTLFQGIRVFDRPSRDYNAIELTVSRKFSGLFVQGSYTYSKTEGNYPGSVSYDNGQIDPNISSQYDLIELLENRRGPLPQDRPHSVKLDAYYGWQLGTTGTLTVGARIRAISGIPENALASHYLYGPNESFLLPRGSLGRTDFEHGIDLHVGYRRKLPHGTAAELYVDAFNIYNNQATFDVDTTYAPPFRIDGTPNNANPISGGSYDDLIWAKAVDTKGFETSRPLGRNPNFLNTASRYAPASAQLGFRFTF